MVEMLLENFEVQISPSTVGSRKKMRRHRPSNEMTTFETIVSYKLGGLSNIKSYHVVYGDESGCDTSVCDRRPGRGRQANHEQRR